MRNSRELYQRIVSIAVAVTAIVSASFAIVVGLVAQHAARIGIEVLITAAILSIGFAMFSAYVTIVYRRHRKQQIKQRRVFVSYSSIDRIVAYEVAQLLQDKGFDPWLADARIEAGEKWSEAIAAALEESPVVVVLLSQHFLHSSSAQKELRLLLSKIELNEGYSTPVIPVKLDEAPIPSELSEIQYVDWKSKRAPEYLVSGVDNALKRFGQTMSAE